ncbi:MAG: hypothetical protein LBU81_00925 [Methanosarcinales archaeon]|jgi:hypothetical protein|nr:hypothetical protein [Methanosarcinales archaeon]
MIPWLDENLLLNKSNSDAVHKIIESTSEKENSYGKHNNLKVLIARKKAHKMVLAELEKLGEDKIIEEYLKYFGKYLGDLEDLVDESDFMYR